MRDYIQKSEDAPHPAVGMEFIVWSSFTRGTVTEVFEGLTVVDFLIVGNDETVRWPISTWQRRVTVVRVPDDWEDPDG